MAMRKRRLAPRSASPTWNEALMIVPLAACSRSVRPFSAAVSSRPPLTALPTTPLTGAALLVGSAIRVVRVYVGAGALPQLLRVASLAWGSGHEQSGQPAEGPDDLQRGGAPERDVLASADG